MADSDLAALAALRDDLRDAVREAREALKDLRAERKRWQPLPDQVYGRIDQAVAQGLKEYETALETAIKTGTEAVFRRFDQISAILLGEDSQSRRAGDPSIPGLMRDRRGVDAVRAWQDGQAIRRQTEAG